MWKILIRDSYPTSPLDSAVRREGVYLIHLRVTSSLLNKQDFRMTLACFQKDKYRNWGYEQCMIKYANELSSKVYTCINEYIYSYAFLMVY